MHQTPSRLDRATASNAPHPDRPTPGFQAVPLALFVAGLWALSHPSQAATLATVAGLAVTVALYWRPVRANRPDAGRTR